MQIYAYIYESFGFVSFLLGVAGFNELINRAISAILEKLRERGNAQKNPPSGDDALGGDSRSNNTGEETRSGKPSSGNSGNSSGSGPTPIGPDVPPNIPEPPKIFVDGQDFESTMVFGDTTVESLAEVRIHGSELTLDNVTIYASGGDSVNEIGPGAFVSWINAVEDMARREGYTTLKIVGTRVANSSSANPGKTVEIIRDLTK